MTINTNTMNIYQLVACLLSVAMGASIREDRADQRCCKDLGCYSNSPPFGHFPLPSCPDHIKPTYSLYTRDNPNEYQRITTTTIPPNFRAGRRTIFIVHGWLGSKDWLDWMYTMRDKFLAKEDVNIVHVDWSAGSVDIWYPQSASNTRTVGGQTFLIMRNLVQNGGATWNDMYCIGHSLGAHACGFAGKKSGGRIQRITGLDPAGPWFGDNPPEARLDKGDAVFQDNIHSDGNRILLPLGIGKAIGHLDFFPNGNRIMPGCISYARGFFTTVTGKPQGLGDVAACSHHRCIHYYTESIRSKCQFKASPCSSNEDADDNKCDSCSGAECQYMGYDAENHPGRGIYFTRTNEDSPYCRG